MFINGSNLVGRYLIQALMVLLLTTVLMSIAIKVSVNSDVILHENLFWSLKQKMRLELHNLHWEWQGNGRPDASQRRVDQAIPLSAQGWPIIEASDNGCRQLITYLNNNDSKVIEKMNITTSLVTQLDKQLNKPVCLFYMPSGSQFTYELNSGNLM